MQTNWRDFGIGMASGIAFCFVLYFGWGLIHPQRPEPANAVATSNATVGMDENALVAANAERPNNRIMTPPPQLRPEPRNEVRDEPALIPEPRLEPPLVRPRPERDPEEDLPPPEDPGLDDDYGGKPPPE
jgi:hypothetical protein